MKAVGLAGLAIVLAASSASALDISTKKLQVKMHDDPAKKQFQAMSTDDAVTYEHAVAPGVDGASIHIYSATDDLCYLIPGGIEWTEKAGKSWKYKNKITKNQIQIADGKLQVKLRSAVNLNLSNPEGEYNVVVQLGDAGEAFCMTCSGAGVIRDDDQKFQGKDCAAAPCDAPPSICNPTVTTTTSTSTTSTTLPALPGTELKLVLPRTNGLWNFNATPGVAGADAACNAAFAGTHACTAAELLIAESAGDLDNIQDTSMPTPFTVTSFWALDAARPEGEQCVSVLGGGGTRWDYLTAHIDSKGDRFGLTNATGDLGPIQENVGCGSNSWVGCCQ